MFDPNSVPAKVDMSYWFEYDRAVGGWYVFKKEDDNDGFSKEHIAVVHELGLPKPEVEEIAGLIGSTDCEGILKAFNIFKNGRPEYIMHVYPDDVLLIDEAGSQDLLDARVHVYTTYLAGAMLLHGSTMSQVTRCIDWLGDAGFYNAPASTRFHESFPGGLMLHSLRVMVQIMQLSTLPAFESVDAAEAILIALAHDWCKVGKYEMYMKNVKDENTGAWNKEPAYKYKDTPMPFGHGMTSLWVLQKFVKIRMEEALAVRWHMGRWYVDDAEINDLQQSNKMYPLVHMLQFADQLAITSYAM